MAAPSERRPRGISKNVYVLTIAAVAVLGFIAGTRSSDIMAAIGPALGFKVAKQSINLDSIEKTYQQLAANYDGKLDTEKLIDGANHGLVAAAGDKYTIYMDAGEAKVFDEDLSGDIGGGIGAEIGERDGQPTILRVLPDNPAGRVGLQAGDRITAINGDSAKGWTADKTANKIRGEVGTTVKLTVLRAGVTHTFTITRATVNNPSVSSRVEGDTGIMTITRFDDQTGVQAQHAAEDFVNRHVKKVILDLRDNGGGYLTAAQKVASLWLDSQVVVTERSGGTVVNTLKSGDNAPLHGLPTIVLVNGASASASEIVSGALQDHHAAILIGEKTFGKGSVQKVIELGGGNLLKVTVARWYTPDGKNITAEGITPNKTVPLSKADVEAGRDPQLQAARAYLATK